MTDSDDRGGAEPRATGEASAELDPRARRRRVLRKVAVSAVAVAALAFVAYMVPLRDRCDATGCEPGLLSVLRGADLGLVAALLGLYLASTLAWAARWRALLEAAGARVSLLGVWRITLEAQAGGILLPGGIGGDALRIAYVRSRAPEADLPAIISSVLVDRVVGLVTLATLACCAGLGTRGHGVIGPSGEILAAIPVGAAVVWFVLRRPALAQARALSSGVLGRTVAPMLALVSGPAAPRAIVKAVLLSSVVSAVQLIVVRGLVAALGGQAAEESLVYVGSTYAMIVAAIPALPGGWGTADAAYVFFLGQAGIAASVAASVCMIARVFWYASGVIGAALALGRRAPEVS